jgi:pimeloyl-ACP methyl ester carboxylesterase
MLQPMIRVGKGEPLVLLHGVLGSERMWARVVPLLASDYDVMAPTALGHRGGRPASRHPVRIEDVADDAERTLDELGLAQVHLAGNSMGGWVALELARRGRARSVCALSPAGAWEVGSANHARSRARLRTAMRQSRLGRPLLPLAARSPAFRRYALRVTAAHGDRVGADELVGIVDDLLGCAVGPDLLTGDDRLEPLTPAPCPVTIAWAALDRIFPVTVNGPQARELVPDAAWVVLDDVGHVPMLDAPDRVAATIRAACPRAPAAVDQPTAGEVTR